MKVPYLLHIEGSNMEMKVPIFQTRWDTSIAKTFNISYEKGKKASKIFHNFSVVFWRVFSSSLQSLIWRKPALTHLTVLASLVTVYSRMWSTFLLLWHLYILLTFFLPPDDGKVLKVGIAGIGDQEPQEISLEEISVSKVPRKPILPLTSLQVGPVHLWGHMKWLLQVADWQGALISTPHSPPLLSK